jgi:hypothetical protein
MKEEDLRKINDSNKMTLVWFFVVLVFVAGIVISGAAWLLTKRESAHREQVQKFLQTKENIEGVVNKKRCANHGLVIYTWTWNGQSFKGSGLACDTSCENLTIGRTQQLLFSPLKPQYVYCANGSDSFLLSTESTKWRDLALLSAILIVIIWKAWSTFFKKDT